MDKVVVETRKGQRAVKLPEENIEYTFIFPGRKTYKFVFHGINNKGRLIMYNATTKSFTSMTPGWFNNLRKKQLLAENVISDTYESLPCSTNAEERKNNQKNNNVSTAARVKLERKPLSFEEQILLELRSTTELEKIAIISKVGRSPEEIADDLEKMQGPAGDNCSQEFINKVCSEMLRARNIYLGLDVKAVAK